MALDLAGMLTGVSKQPIDPRLNMQQQQLALGANATKMMQGGMESMRRSAGGEAPVAQQLQMAMSKLDLQNPDDLRKLISIQMATGDTVGAAKTASMLQAMKQAPLDAAKEEKRYQDKLALDIRRTGATEQTAAAALARAKAANEKSPLSQGSFKGESFKVKDEDGNLFAAITTYDKDAKKVVVSYSNLSADGSRTPVGKVTPVGGVYSLTGLESIDLASQKTSAVEGSKLFTNRKAVAADNYTAAGFALEDANKMMTALKQIRTGGALTAISKEVTDFLGTTPTSVSEFERLAKAKVLAGLKRFGANPTEGERNFAIQLGENLSKTEGANEAQIQSFIDEMTRVMSRERYLLSSEVTEDAFKEYTLNQWGDSNKENTSKTTDGVLRVNFLDFKKD